MQVQKYETNFKRNQFWHKSTINAKNNPEKQENKVINIYPNITYQEIIGFGGAFTESAGYAYSKLSDSKKANLINDYFSQNGLNYSMGRLPIGSCDFSLNSYSYSKIEGSYYSSLDYYTYLKLKELNSYLKDIDFDID